MKLNFFSRKPFSKYKKSKTESLKLLFASSLVAGLTITPDGFIAISPKGIIAVEHYFLMRDIMYKSVYNHRLNEISTWLLEKIFETAINLDPSRVWIDNQFSDFIIKKEISIKTFLSNDDIRTYYHILRWSEDSPEVLSNLCKMFLNRSLLKAIDIKDLSPTDRLNLLAKARFYTEKKNLNANLYCGIKNKDFSPYQNNSKSIRLWDGKRLQAFEEVSSLVKNLQNRRESSWLIYPKEIQNSIYREFSSLKGII